jgi:hypothetical protein
VLLVPQNDSAQPLELPQLFKVLPSTYIMMTGTIQHVIVDSPGLHGRRLGFLGAIPGGGWEVFSSPPRPERLWGPPSLQGALSLGVKWPGREADHSPPSSAEVKE